MMSANHRAAVADFRIPILMYHEVTTADKIGALSRRTQSSFIVTAPEFEKQMKFLSDHAIRTIMLDDLIEAIESQGGLRLPPNAVVITFDDGFAGNYEHAFPTLMAYGLRATFFVIVNKIGSNDMMCWDQLKEISQAGMSIQSHTMSHTLLGQLSRDKVQYELEASKHRIEEKLGSGVKYISFPMGSYKRSYAEIGWQVGYRGGCTSQIGFAKRNSSSFFMPRIVVDGKYDLSQFSRLIDHKSKMVESLALRQKLKGVVRHTAGERLYNYIYNRVYAIET